MKKQNSRRIVFVVLGLLVVIALVVVGAVVSVFAYRQFVADDALKLSFEIPLQDQGGSMQRPASKGVVVTFVEPDSPADAAGLRRGVIILAVNGQEVNTSEELRKAIQAHEAGKSITLTVLEGDQEKELQATLASASPYLGVNVAGTRGVSPDIQFDQALPLPEELEELLPHLGQEGFESLPPRMNPPDSSRGRFFFEFPEFEGDFQLPVIILSVVTGSPADEAGMLPQDIILEVDGQKIENQDRLIEFISKTKPGEVVELTIWRSGEIETVSVTLGEHPDKEGQGYLGLNLSPRFDRQFFFNSQNE